MEKPNEKCVECGSDDWEREQLVYKYNYKCKKCGYIFDPIDYIQTKKQAGRI